MFSSISLRKTSRDPFRFPWLAFVTGIVAPAAFAIGSLLGQYGINLIPFTF